MKEKDVVQRITPHFTLHEITESVAARQHNLPNNLPPELYQNALRMCQFLEEIREHMRTINPSAYIKVTSLYRSPAVNKAVGGSATSAHMKALACDFEVQGIDNITVCREIAKKFAGRFDQLIYEFGPSGWVHVGLSRSDATNRHQLLSAVKENGKTMYKQGIIA